MPKFYGAIDLVKNELQNAVIQNLGSAPTSPVKGQIYMSSTDNILYWYNGTTWVPAMDTGAGALTPASSVVAETSFAQVSAVGSSLNYARQDHTHGSPTHDAAAHVAIPISNLAGAVSTINMGNFQILNVGTPVNPNDGANKSYVDSVASGISWKNPVKVATTVNITLSGTQTIDGVSVVINDRVLVKNQATAADNGIYVVQSAVWTRALDSDTTADFEDAAVFVSQGTTQADTAWVQTAYISVVGTTPQSWVQFGAPASYIAGSGLTLTGLTFDVGAGIGITVAPDSIAVDSAVVALKSDLTVYPKKYAAAIAGTSSPETITHNLNTRDVVLTIYNGVSPYTAVEVDWDAATANTVVIRYSPNLGAGYRAVILG